MDYLQLHYTSSLSFLHEQIPVKHKSIWINKTTVLIWKLWQMHAWCICIRTEPFYPEYFESQDFHMSLFWGHHLAYTHKVTINSRIDENYTWLILFTLSTSEQRSSTTSFFSVQFLTTYIWQILNGQLLSPRYRALSYKSFKLNWNQIELMGRHKWIHFRWTMHFSHHFPVY